MSQDDDDDLQNCKIIMLFTDGTDDDIQRSSNDTSFYYYNVGIKNGIIDPQKYPFASFIRDERNVFKDLYQEFLNLHHTAAENYGKWLILNNYGILADTRQSLFDRKLVKRGTADNKRRFINAVKKGYILITGRGLGGLVGHAAIMTSDYWVLEMPGGPGWSKGISDNNRQVSKHDWFDLHASDWTSVYRCPDGGVARAAAGWADRTYYNPRGGAAKVKHITYRLTANLRSISPSYCSKLVIQAYYYGTGSRRVIRSLAGAGYIVPANIPMYFLSPYTLKFLGRY